MEIQSKHLGLLSTEKQVFDDGGYKQYFESSNAYLCMNQSKVSIGYDDSRQRHNIYSQELPTKKTDFIDSFDSFIDEKLAEGKVNFWGEGIAIISVIVEGVLLIWNQNTKKFESSQRL